MEMEKMEGEEEMRSSLLRDGEGEGLCVTWEGLCVCVQFNFFKKKRRENSLDRSKLRDKAKRAHDSFFIFLE